MLRLLTGENWMNTLIQLYDKIGPEALLIYCILSLLVHVMVLNLFVGLIINNFWKVKEEMVGYTHLGLNERKWIEMQRIMLRKDLIIKIKYPENEFR